MLQSSLLSANARIRQAASGGPSIKRRPPDDDFDAVQRIQRALKEIGYQMPNSYKGGVFDGRYGEETYRCVLDFQRHAFPDQPSQWDGRVGKFTLAELDNALMGSGEGVEAPTLDVASSTTTITAKSGFA